MGEEATKNAREVAEKFAKDPKSQIWKNKKNQTRTISYKNITIDENFSI